MKINKAIFLTSAPTLAECSKYNLPEFPLIGRSNVGKSSFINALVNIKGLAKTSNTPGKTKLINLFQINDNFVFADLPGYGFAKVSAKTQNLWQKNLEEYLLKRENIVSLIMLVDSRLDIQDNDLKMAEWIHYNNLPAFCIASKVDKIPKSKILNKCLEFEKILNMSVLPFSKENDSYNKNILEKLEELLHSP